MVINMDRNAIPKDKDFGINLTPSDLEILPVLKRSFDKEHSLILHGSGVALIHFEGRGTDFVLAVLEILNPHLLSFRLRLTLEEPVSARDQLMRHVISSEYSM
jgi:hypothetical protein